MSEWRKYQKKNAAEMRAYVKGEGMSGISISTVDQENGSPKNGDYIARNPNDHNDQWLVSATYFAENYEP